MPSPNCVSNFIDCDCAGGNSFHLGLFFLAFLPQFVDARSSVAFQILFLGLLFNVGGTLVNLVVAYAGGAVGELLRRNPRFTQIQRWFTGLVFVGLGARLAWQRR